jgi:uncharacterized membrane protein YdjX (TVP38/TMEM64 family)
MQHPIARILKFSLIILLVAGVIWGINQIGVEQLRTEVQRFGAWAPLALLVLRFVSIVIPILPGTFYALLAGGLFGFGTGLVTIVIADTLACVLNFYLARRYGRSLVQKLVGATFMDRVDRFSRQHLERNFFLTTGFMMGGGFDFVAYGIGLTQTRWRTFLSALGLSLMAAKPPTVALGAGLFSGGQAVIGIALVSCFALAIVTALVNRKKEKPSAE